MLATEIVERTARLAIPLRLHAQGCFTNRLLGDGYGESHAESGRRIRD